MSCNECNKFQESEQTSFVRVGKANIEVRACPEHLKIVFAKLNSHPDLLKVLKIMTGLCKIKYGNLDKKVWAEILKAEQVIEAAESEE